jgi:hypothetical protein
LKEEAKFEEKVDGAFFIGLGDYQKRFGSTNINYDPTNWDRTSFLMLKDKTTNPGSHSKCGQDCIRHEFKLTSDIR